MQKAEKFVIPRRFFRNYNLFEFIRECLNPDYRQREVFARKAARKISQRNHVRFNPILWWERLGQGKNKFVPTDEKYLHRG